MVITDTPTTVFEKISMDIVGLLPDTKSGNLCILTTQDSFTKYYLTIPLPNHQASTIVDAFVKNLFAYLDQRKEYLLTKAEIFKVIG